MKKINDDISDILEVEYCGTQEVIEYETPCVPEKITDEAVTDDAEYARANIKRLITKGNKAIDKLLLVAGESEAPRAYEVIATMLKNIADLNKDLLELHKRKKDLEPKDCGRSNINVDKAIVFTGSTTELLKIIKQNKE
jgi:hypothetical protein